MTPIFTAKTATVDIAIQILLESSTEEYPTNLAKSTVGFYAEDAEGFGLNYYTPLTDALKATVVGLHPISDEYVEVSVPEVTFNVYADYDQRIRLRSYAIPANLLRPCIEQDGTIKPASILELIEKYFGGFSGNLTPIAQAV